MAPGKHKYKVILEGAAVLITIWYTELFFMNILNNRKLWAIEDSIINFFFAVTTKFIMKCTNIQQL